jgi:hypothetical protein
MEAVCQPELPGEEEAMKCAICGREAAVDLCPNHAVARDNLKAAYHLWMKAYGRIGWDDYLDNVKRNLQTGQWAKETAEFLKGG